MFTNITNESIKEYCERAGYDKYIPFDFFKTVMLYHDEAVRNGYIMYDNYEYDFRVFMESIFLNTEVSSAQFALQVLRTIDSRVNLRDMGNEIRFEPIPQYNYDIDLRACDRNIKQLLNITDAEYNTVKLDKDVLELLRRTSGATIGKGYNKVTCSKVGSMQSYGDYVKVNITQRVLPSFSHKFAKKELPVKIKTTKDVCKEFKVLAIDISASANSEAIRNFIYMGSIALAPLFQVSGFKLKVIFFSDHIHHAYNCTSIADLQYLCATKFNDAQMRKTWLHSASYMKEHFPGEEITIITDGTEEHMYTELLEHCVISSISKTFNTELNDLCKRTGGTFICLE